MSVYFVESCGLMKIGYSKDPIGRSTTVTRNGTRPDSIPFDAPTTLVGWIPGTMRDEGRLHAQFADHRIEGEWFDLPREVVAPIIWADPCGVDIHRMSATAVIAMNHYRDMTRDEVASHGIPVEAAPREELMAHLDAALSLSARSA